MAPKSSTKSSTSTSKKATSGTLTKAKQATLGFPPSRTGSNVSSGSKTGKQGGGTLSRTNSALKPAVTSEDEIEVEKSEGNSYYGELISSDDDELETTRKPTQQTVVVPSKTRAAAAAVNRKKINASPPVTELSDKAGKWNAHYAEVREKMGHMHAIHGENQTKIDEILRVFDLTDDYGPCIGVSRLDRWERASAMGLNPPSAVWEILQTQEARSNPQYRENVFFGEV